MKKIFAILMVVAMMFAVAVPMSAEISPEPELVYDVEVGIVPENGGEVTETDNGDGTVTLTVNPSDGSRFIKWEIEGDYDIISGDEYSTTLVIRPKSDVVAKANVDGTAVEPTPTPKPDDDEKSPSTGVAPVLMAVAFVASMAGAGYSFKKSGE